MAVLEADGVAEVVTVTVATPAETVLESPLIPMMRSVPLVAITTAEAAALERVQDLLTMTGTIALPDEAGENEMTETMTAREIETETKDMAVEGDEVGTGAEGVLARSAREVNRKAHS